ncbi:MAG: hypothetical protein LBL67_00040 [Coriobacteriales bacterium]|jgi:Flp pilus assembly pilin Flp|nr:hypothetical protein [Coriobacteriales bacterium]
MYQGLKDLGLRLQCRLLDQGFKLKAKVKPEQGQGTVEYAIIVAVIVVIAIVCIVLFKDKISELWHGIADNVNELELGS